MKTPHLSSCVRRRIATLLLLILVRAQRTRQTAKRDHEGRQRDDDGPRRDPKVIELVRSFRFAFAILIDHSARKETEVHAL